MGFPRSTGSSSEVDRKVFMHYAVFVDSPYFKTDEVRNGVKNVFCSTETEYLKRFYRMNGTIRMREDLECIRETRTVRSKCIVTDQ